MAHYRALGWKIIKYPNSDDYYLFADLGLGWKRNSGISGFSEDKGHYYFSGYSGSVYKCSKVDKELSPYPSSVLKSAMVENPEIREVNIEEFLSTYDVQPKH